MTRKSYRVFSAKEMAKNATGIERDALLEMIDSGWCREPYVERVDGSRQLGRLLVANGAKDGEMVVIEE